MIHCIVVQAENGTRIIVVMNFWRNLFVVHMTASFTKFLKRKMTWNVEKGCSGSFKVLSRALNISPWQ